MNTRDILSVFHEDNVKLIARKTGFILRERKLKSIEFLILMTFSTMSATVVSLASMVAAIDASMSREAMHYRFNKAAADFLLCCLEWVMDKAAYGGEAIQAEMLDCFERVMIQDSTSWDINRNLQSVFPGFGGSASPANCKLQLSYEYKKGHLGLLETTPGNAPDQSFSPTLKNNVLAGDLWIFDLGYFALHLLHEIADRSAYYVCRYRIGTTVVSAKTLELLNLQAILDQASGATYELDVILGTDPRYQVRCRIICLRASQEVAEIRRRKLNKEAKKKGRTSSNLHLALCDWTIFITNVPARLLPAGKVMPMYRIRWQIELIFKQFKSILRVHKSNTSKECRLRCELYGKLIAAVIVHAIHGYYNAGFWNSQRKELSFDKLWKRIKERSQLISIILYRTTRKASDCLASIVNSVLRTCIKYSQPSRPTSLERLLMHDAACVTFQSLGH